MPTVTPPGSAVGTPISNADCCATPCPACADAESNSSLGSHVPGISALCADCCEAYQFQFDGRGPGPTMTKGGSWGNPCVTGRLTDFFSFVSCAWYGQDTSVAGKVRVAFMLANNPPVGTLAPSGATQPSVWWYVEAEYDVDGGGTCSNFT